MKKSLSLLFLFLGIITVYCQTAPETVNDSYTTNIDTPLTVDVANGLLSNDSDADGDALSITTIRINGTDFNAGQTANVFGGSVTVNSDGSLTYNPTAGFAGGLPLIVYTVFDGTTTSVGNLYITINAPDTLVAEFDFDTVDINTTLSVPSPGVLGNDIFEDINTVEVTSFLINTVQYNAGETANLGAGSFTLFSDGSFVFIPSSGYTGDVPVITYTIFDGLNTSISNLFLTVEDIEDLVLIESFSSCNQGFSTDGTYNIQYAFSFTNLSMARDYHSSSMIKLVDVFKDIDAIYGNGCVISVENISVTTSVVDDFIDNPYPLDFDVSAVNPDFIDGTSGIVFDPSLINDIILYPRQQVSVNYCLVVEPFCNGRPNPTPSGSGVDFDALLEIDSSTGQTDFQLLLTDFHTTEAIITSVLDIPINNPDVNPDGTYDFTNSVTLINDGNNIANNVNFNMGLGDFLNNGLTFNTLVVTQISGPPVNINTNYDGDTSTFLLEPNNSLSPGETIVLEIFSVLDPVGTTGNNNFFQINPSQTLGGLDGFDENTADNRRLYTFALWDDNLGSHTDRYYSNVIISDPESINQCECVSRRMTFEFTSNGVSEKIISNINSSPDGILEYEELTFQLFISNSSPVVDLNNLQIEEDLTGICGNLPLSIISPTIISSTASVNPNLNIDFDGVLDTNIFDGQSGLLMTGESITIEFTVLFSEDCIGQNTIIFTGTDPVGNVATTTASVDVDASTDWDNDGITNTDDIDDDNDTVPDILEYNGLDPLDDDDGDFIPNYRDLDFGADSNNDGIVDSFDFDSDGVPNHLDVDSDGDGIYDITEVGNSSFDTNSNGQTNNPVGINGLDNTIETDDTFGANITFNITDTDADTNPDYFDIDSDGDGIVDNIEAQTTDGYQVPDFTVSMIGIDTAYAIGLDPIDTDSDGVPDYLDTNSDDDLRDDNIEGWDFDSNGNAETSASGNDIDNDGLDDAYDNLDTAVNPTNGQLPTDFPNADYDVTPERDWRELMAVVVIIDDISELEGNSFLFTISLVRFIDNSETVQSTTPIDITLFTSDGSIFTNVFDVATSPFDYDSITDFEITIPAFTETFQVTVNSLDDNISELDEMFTLNANITTDNTINIEAFGIGTILDDEPLPTVTMNDDIVNEGEELSYTFSLDIPSSTPIEINIVSLDNTANAPFDYTSINIDFTIPETIDPSLPNLSDSFTITTLLDNIDEADEEFLSVVGNVNSNNVTNPLFSNTGTIIDLNPTPLVIITDDTVVEGNTLVFTLSLVNPNGVLMTSSLPVNFEIETLDITATSSLDYTFLLSDLTIPALESSVSISISTFDDNLNEQTETMNLSATILEGVVDNNSAFLFGLGTILDNDIPNLFTPNNDGLSDVFRIDGIEAFPNFKLVIIDRWGGKIYNYSNNGNLSPAWWDGTKDGDPVVEGVYFYTLDFNDGVTKPKTGFIQLQR